MEIAEIMYAEGARLAERTVLKVLMHFLLKQEVPWWANEEALRNSITKVVDAQSDLIKDEYHRQAIRNGADEALVDLFEVIELPPPS